MKVNKINVSTSQNVRSAEKKVAFGFNPLIEALGKAEELCSNGNFPASVLDARIVDSITKKSNWTTKFFTITGKSAGEVQNSLITAFGTTLVAPFVIAFNPISKEDKNTRTYSAWRQPVSAIIALGFQLPVSLWFNNWINNNASKGYFKAENWTDIKNPIIDPNNINIDAKPSSSYLRKLIKSENPFISKKALEERVIATQDIAKHNEVQRLRGLEGFDATNLEDLIKAKDFKAEVTRLKNTSKDNNVNSEFKTKISRLELNRKTKEEFILQEAKDKAKKAVIEEIEIEAQKKFRMTDLVIAYDTDWEKALEDVKTQIARLPESATEQEKKILEAIRTKILDRHEGFADSKYFIRNAENKVIKSVDIDEIRRAVRIKKFVLARLDRSEAVLKQNNVVGGLIVTMVTLPVSCGILNWMYPRIMEKIMPDVTAKKKAKETK